MRFFYLQGFALSVEALSLVCPSGSVLFFASPKKSTKRKANPEAGPLRGFPVLLVKPGARATRCAQTGRERHPGFTAMLGCARRGVKFKTTTPDPSALTEYRRQSGIRGAAV